MSLATLEREIIAEANVLLKTGRKLKIKDIQEWSTGEVESREDETRIHLKDLGLTIVFKTELLRKAKAVIPE
jgi:seryl-tRNA(Sec) selenium transferase